MGLQVTGHAMPRSLEWLWLWRRYVFLDVHKIFGNLEQRLFSAVHFTHCELRLTHKRCSIKIDNHAFDWSKCEMEQKTKSTVKDGFVNCHLHLHRSFKNISWLNQPFKKKEVGTGNLFLKMGSVKSCHQFHVPRFRKTRSEPFLLCVHSPWGVSSLQHACLPKPWSPAGKQRYS